MARDVGGQRTVGGQVDRRFALAFLIPGLVLAFLISLGAVWLNDVASSWGQKGIRGAVLQSVEQIAYGMLRTYKSYSTSRFAINVLEVEGNETDQPHAHVSRFGRQATFHVDGTRSELRLSADKTALHILLTDSEFELGTKLQGRLPGSQVQEISLTEASRKGDSRPIRSNCAVHEIPSRIEQQRETIRSLQQKLAAEAACQMLTGEFVQLTGSHWEARHMGLRNTQQQLYRLQLITWRRWANGFSCLFFVMVGAPLAIRLKNADVWTSFGLCFLPILIVYYPLLMYGLDRARVRALPYFIWLGNLVLLGIGTWLLRSVMRR